MALTKKRLAILGSTGSVGCNVLQVVDGHPERFQIVALAARCNIERLYEQAAKYRPKWVGVYDADKAIELEKRLKKFKIRVVAGVEGLSEICRLKEVDQIMMSVVGAVGLIPLWTAIENGKCIGIANKEPLVMAGDLMMRMAAKYGAKILPIDSEHSGLWQCLEGRNRLDVKQLVITSSGGPFFRKNVCFDRVTAEQALRHPKWKMGPKITVDSATLMNKGLEVIEAANLFHVDADQIRVVIHPEAVIHALVEFIDGSQIAQLGITDMKLPIQYALSYPGRMLNSLPGLNLTKIRDFHFYEPDLKRFPCLELGYAAKRTGGTMPAVLNAANEVAVMRFLNGTLSFNSIPTVIERVMGKHKPSQRPTLRKIIEADRWAREKAEVICQSF